VLKVIAPADTARFAGIAKHSLFLSPVKADLGLDLSRNRVAEHLVIGFDHFLLDHLARFFRGICRHVENELVVNSRHKIGAERQCRFRDPDDGALDQVGGFRLFEGQLGAPGPSRVGLESLRTLSVNKAEIASLADCGPLFLGNLLGSAMEVYRGDLAVANPRRL
jgi:hypothetical protein